MASEPIPSTWLDSRLPSLGQGMVPEQPVGQYEAHRSRRSSVENTPAHLAAYFNDLALQPSAQGVALGPCLPVHSLPGASPAMLQQDALSVILNSVAGLPVPESDPSAALPHAPHMSRSSSVAGSDWFPIGGGLPVSNPLMQGSQFNPQQQHGRGSMDFNPYAAAGAPRGMVDPSRQHRARRHSLAFGSLPRPLGPDGTPLPMPANMMPPTVPPSGRNRRGSCEVNPAAMAAALGNTPAAMAAAAAAAAAAGGMMPPVMGNMRGSNSNLAALHQQQHHHHHQQQQQQQHLAALGQSYGRGPNVMPGQGGKGRRHSWCPSNESGRMALARMAAQRNAAANAQQFSPDHWLLQQQQQLDMLPYGSAGPAVGNLPRGAPANTPTSTANSAMRLGYNLPAVPMYGELQTGPLPAGSMLDGGLGLPQGDPQYDLMLAAAAAASGAGSSTGLTGLPLDMAGLPGVVDGLTPELAELLLLQQQQQQQHQQLATAMGLSMSLPGDVDLLNQLAANGMTAESWRQDLAELMAYSAAPYVDTWEGGAVPASRAAVVAHAPPLGGLPGSSLSPGARSRDRSSSTHSSEGPGSTSPPPAAPAAKSKAAGGGSAARMPMAIAPEPVSQVCGSRPWDLKKLAVEEVALLQQHERLASQLASLLMQRRTLKVLAAAAAAAAAEQQQSAASQQEPAEDVTAVDFAYRLPDSGADAWGGAAAAVYEHSGCISCDPSNKLFVGNIGWWVTEEDLLRWFSMFGTVTQVKIMYNSRKMHKSKDKWRSREYGFVDYASREEAAKAIVWMDGVELPELMKDNCGIIVQYAKPTSAEP